MDRHVILNVIEWNRQQLDWAWKERQHPNKTVAIKACRDARRFAANISALQAQL